MHAHAGARLDPILVLSAVAGGVALAWLAPLMLDQLVLFGDQEQSQRAAVSRDAMVPAGALLLAAAGGVLSRGRPLHALVVALPALTAVPLALLVPAALYQLLAYAITAPMSLGALLAAAIPLPVHLSWAVTGPCIAILAGLALAGSPFLAAMVFLFAFVWWRMPREWSPPRQPTVHGA